MNDNNMMMMMMLNASSSSNFWSDNVTSDNSSNNSDALFKSPMKQNCGTTTTTTTDSIYDHISMSLPFPANNNNIDNDNNDMGGVQGVLSILDAAEDLLDDVDALNTSAIPLEPIPLGPMGSLNLVRQVPLVESAGVLLQDNQVDMEALFDALNPLMASPAIAAKDCRMPTKRGVLLSTSSSSSSLPAPKRRRVSVEPDDENILSSFSVKMNNNWDTSSNGQQQQQDQQDQGTDEERFRPYQFDQWKDRFQDLVEFREKNGHCLVPHNFPENQQLAQWIKRQRYQYKLKQMKRHSTLTDERQTTLENMGFVWDSHKAAWIERFESLKEFQAKHGHCSVPSNYIDRSLAIWVKCQRRQYKLFQQGAKSTMTVERFTQLDQMGFSWNPRNLK